ncbi:uncharacterized protein LOC143003899 [Genypterus blacodes]|uniref:uncharacterized protein LOC143003899 n=1 Tax=Genypterus blacodes TaxID=154954 RepID=UPI003F777297
MDSQLATVLTSGSLGVQNGSQCAGGSGQVTDDSMEPKGKSSSGTPAGNLQPCPLQAGTISQDALSINRNKPEVGGISEPASQGTHMIGGLRQPITVKTGVPVFRSQPIRIKIVVPPRCKRPITNSATSLTKDFPHSHFTRAVLVSRGAVITETNTNKMQIGACPSAVRSQGDMMEMTSEQTEEVKAESLSGTDGENCEEMCKEKDNVLLPETPFISCSETLQVLTRNENKEEIVEKEWEKSIPVIFQALDLKAAESKKVDEAEMEEQTEPLDLSLPKKAESRERGRGLSLDDCDGESSLIMEVDEYDGEGDRDVVEEDDGDDEGEGPAFYTEGADRLLSPSFFSTSVLTSLSALDCDTENLLLIDDQGIPYTLSPDGHKVPQVDVSKSEDSQTDQLDSVEVERKGSPQPASLARPVLSQSLDDAPSEYLRPPPTTAAAESPSQGAEQSSDAELRPRTQLTTDSDPSGASQPRIKAVQETKADLPRPSGMSLCGQPIQILTSSSTNTPILLLSTSSSGHQLSSASVGLSLPISVTQTSPGASAPMLLLLSSVPSSSGDSASTSTPIAVLDPATGQLSHITASSGPVCLPLSSATLGSPVATLSHPVIRLSPNNPPVILPGLNNSLTPASVLTSRSVQSTISTLQTSVSPAEGAFHSMTPLNHNQISSSKPETKATSAQPSKEDIKPSTLTAAAATAAAAAPPSSSLLSDTLGQIKPDPEAEPLTSDPQFEPSDLHLPLEDHLYFSNTAAPPSPPIGPMLQSGTLDPLDSLDPLSPASSPNTMGARRVLYCQLCPRVFFYLSDLERHAITHSQKKPHVCQQCGKAFKRSSHLQRHKHIHTGQRNFVCPICTKRFREAGELQRHQRVHTGEKPYQCQLCHTRFAERNTLRRHTKRKHPYHQVAMEMLSERRDGGGGGGVGVKEEEESAEWYSSTVSNLENSESEAET